MNRLNETINESMSYDENKVDLAKYQQMIQLVQHLLNEKRQPPKIEPHYTVKSSHSKILEKVLNRTYGLDKNQSDQQSQTDFDGVFIGKINGIVEAGRLKTENPTIDRTSEFRGLGLKRNTSLKTSHFSKTKSAHGRRVNRPKTALRFPQKHSSNVTSVESSELYARDFDTLAEMKSTLPRPIQKENQDLIWY